MLAETYGLYLLLSLFITVWVGRTLHTNGRVFLIENFKGNVKLADSINHLLLVGFYLINFGFICLTLKYGVKPTSFEEGIEFLSSKIGLVIVVLGIMHFFNMYVLVKMRHFKMIPSAQNKEAKMPGGAQMVAGDGDFR